MPDALSRGAMGNRRIAHARQSEGAVHQTFIGRFHQGGLAETGRGAKNDDLSGKPCGQLGEQIGSFYA